MKFTPIPVSIFCAVVSFSGIHAQTLPDYPSLLASDAGTGAALQLENLDNALRRAFNTDIDFGMAPAIAEPFRESPIASLLQHTNVAIHENYSSTSPVSVLTRAASELLGEPLNCLETSLALPDSLDAALEQIEDSAYQVQTQFDSLISTRDSNRLRRYHDDVMALLQRNPFGGDLNRSESRTLRRYIGAMDSVELHAIGCAALSWTRLAEHSWLNRLQDLMAAHARSQNRIIVERETEFGAIILSGSASGSLLQENVLFIADLGGNDIYGIESSAPFSGIPQLIVDFSGNDRYESSRGSSIANGIGSISILLDLEGSDHYDGPALTQGSAIFGAALLMDLNGNDSYNAGTMSQGYGLYGIGLLVDQSGDDSYAIEALGQGLGMTSGLGSLTDWHGDDDYVAGGAIPTNYGTPGLSDAWAQGVGLGVREISRGGIGRFVDGDGSDSFDAGSFAQGGGYYLGVGEFLNLGVDADIYLGSRYNFGWGAHGGIGYFQEAGGDDSYRTRQIVAAGLAWDNSVAFFRDDAGDDTYEMGDFSLGASALNSAALFLDGQGSDTYRGVTPARANQEPPNLSLFFDIGPEQNYLNQQLLDTECRYTGSLSITLLAAEHDDANFDNCLVAED